MKNSIAYLILATSFFVACQPNTRTEPSYTIEAQIVGVPDSTEIFLEMPGDGEMVAIDSAFLKQAKVYFDGTLESPGLVYLRIGDTRKVVTIFAENSDIQVSVHTDSLEDVEISGSAIHNEFLAFKEQMSSIDERQQALNDRYAEAAQAGDTATISQLRKEYQQTMDDQNGMFYNFIEENKSSYLAPFIINRFLVHELDYQGLDSLLQKIDPEVRDSKDYEKLSKRVAVLGSVAVGKPMVDFVLNDPKGNPIAASSFRGKVLLIDFWASWCGPCRRENPNVVKLYNDFKDQGFEILGVSFDTDQNRWVGAIEADQLEWPHVSDLQGWKSAAGELYAINSIPATVLVNREGIIVAKNLRGAELRRKLEEIYAEEQQNS
jgi:peroxiredoxin